MEDKENETSLTDSAIMSDSGTQLTPVPTKESSKPNDEVMNMLQLLLEQQNVKFDEMKQQNEKRFDANDCLLTMSSDINKRFDTNDEKFDKRLSAIDEQLVSVDSCLSTCLLYTSRCV